MILSAENGFQFQYYFCFLQFLVTKIVHDSDLLSSIQKYVQNYVLAWNIENMVFVSGTYYMYVEWETLLTKRKLFHVHRNCLWVKLCNMLWLFTSNEPNSSNINSQKILNVFCYSARYSYAIPIDFFQKDQGHKCITYKKCITLKENFVMYFFPHFQFFHAHFIEMLCDVCCKSPYSIYVSHEKWRTTSSFGFIYEVQMKRAKEKGKIFSIFSKWRKWNSKMKTKREK